MNKHIKPLSQKMYGAAGKTSKLAAMLSIVLLMGGLLSGCQALVGEGGPGGAQPVAAAADSTTAPAAPTETAQPSATRKPRPTATPTVDAARASAEQAEMAVRDYFSALEAGEVEQAAEQLSTFSLMVAEMTRGDAASALQRQRLDGMRWSDLQLTEVIPFDEQTILVRVAYSVTLKGKETPTATAVPAAATKDAASTKAAAEAGAASEAREELWPVRLENGTWRYNWNNLIDYRMLQVTAQTTSGVTVKPVQLNRFSDRIQLVMLVQNRTTAGVVFGQKNEILGTFHFGDQTVEAEKIQVVLNPLRSVPDFKLEAKGLWENYPEAIEIRKWKSYNVEPWYTFQLQ